MTAAAASSATTVKTNGPVFSGMFSHPPRRRRVRRGSAPARNRSSSPTTVLRSPAVRRKREVRRRVPALQDRGDDGAEEHHPEEEQRERPHHTGDQTEPAAEGAGQVAAGQPGTSAVPGHVGRQDHRDQRRPEGLSGLRQAGQCVRAGDVLGQQGPGDGRPESESPKACVAARVRTVCRWTAATSGVGVIDPESRDEGIRLSRYCGARQRSR